MLLLLLTACLCLGSTLDPLLIEHQSELSIKPCKFHLRDHFRPGEKITRKTIMMANKMKELDMKETSSKSLLSNVLDMDDDFRNTTLPTSNPVHHPSHVSGHQNGGFVRYLQTSKLLL